MAYKIFNLKKKKCIHVKYYSKLIMSDYITVGTSSWVLVYLRIRTISISITVNISIFFFKTLYANFQITSNGIYGFNFENLFLGTSRYINTQTNNEM